MKEEMIKNMIDQLRLDEERGLLPEGYTNKVLKEMGI